MRDRFIVLVLLLSVASTNLNIWTDELRHEDTNQGIFLLLIMDFNDFMCPTCLDSLLDFCRQLPVSFRKRCIQGVVVTDKYRKKESGDSFEKIMEKKIKGFVKANHVEFPILLDRNQIFGPLIKKGTSVFIFNTETHAITQHVFPLTLQEVGLIRLLSKSSS